MNIKGEAAMSGRAYDGWRALLRDQALPCAVVDLAAVARNVAALLALLRRPDVTVRIATKSIRHPWLLRHLLDAAPDRVRGLMPWSAHEVEALAALGFDDFLMGYPCARPDEAAALARASARGVRVVATLDHPHHVALLADAARAAGVTLDVCIDLDASWRPLGGVAHVGVQRSPVRSVKQALRLARCVRDAAPHLRLRALLAYEAQVAGMADHGAGLPDAARRLIKARSIRSVAASRARALAALRADGFAIDLINGGGTGSLATSSADPSVTEVTAGSGFLAPHLFDHYNGLALTPALFIALAICRIPQTDIVTCAGGGYVTSGPPGLDRAPLPVAPSLAPLPMEGFGEVQTPLQLPRALRGTLQVGDPIVCRPAKAGEPAERFNRYLLLHPNGHLDPQPTYRGLGWQFF
jgi:D-serine deaminase-like pyridoxal phosphate-dependent protein